MKEIALAFLKNKAEEKDIMLSVICITSSTITMIINLVRLIEISMGI